MKRFFLGITVAMVFIGSVCAEVLDGTIFPIPHSVVSDDENTFKIEGRPEVCLPDPCPEAIIWGMEIYNQALKAVDAAAKPSMRIVIELPEVGTEFKKGETFATIESVKAASEIYMPISGKILEINETAVDTPEILNEDSYEKGWLVKIEATGDITEQNDLLEYEDYKEELE